MAQTTRFPERLMGGQALTLTLKTNGHRPPVTLDCNFRTDQFPKRVMTGTFLLAKGQTCSYGDSLCLV